MKVSKKITAATGTPQEFIYELENKIEELESGVESSTILAEDLENSSSKNYDAPTYSWPEFMNNFFDFFGFDDVYEFEDWITQLIETTGYKTNEAKYFIDYGYDNPCIAFTDGTVWAIDGNNGNDYLVDITEDV